MQPPVQRLTATMKKTFNRTPRLMLSGAILCGGLVGLSAQAQTTSPALNVPTAPAVTSRPMSPSASISPVTPISRGGSVVTVAGADSTAAADAVPAGAAPAATAPTTLTSPEVSMGTQMQNGANASYRSSAASTSGQSASAMQVSAGPAVPATSCVWPAYRRFLTSNVQADGRVIDYTPPAQTTSEGQSYALFFALANNDRTTFDRVLNWTTANLAGGDLSTRLPAWRWGSKPDGSYGVLDPNSASDSDLWIAYDLAQAGRLWHEPRYTALARAMFAAIARREVFDLPGFGLMLAPGQVGFTLAADVWRLNPSYVPLPLLRLAAVYDPSGPWRKIATNTLTMMQAVSPHGFVPDWVAYQTGKGFIVDPQQGDVGSYDAIRAYLWAGMTSHSDPLAKPLLAALNGMQLRIAQNGQVPEKVGTLSGVSTGVGPAGFQAALLPYLRASGGAGAGGAGVAGGAGGAGNAGASVLYNAMRGRVSELSDRASLGYYNGVLTLFGQGFTDGRFQFDARGQLQPNWSNSCRAGTL